MSPAAIELVLTWKELCIYCSCHKDTNSIARGIVALLLIEGTAHVQTTAEFFNLYNHGFIRAAVGIPEVRVADPAFNAARTVELMEQAGREQAVLVLFPEL